MFHINTVNISLNLSAVFLINTVNISLTLSAVFLIYTVNILVPLQTVQIQMRRLVAVSFEFSLFAIHSVVSMDTKLLFAIMDVPKFRDGIVHFRNRVEGL